MTASTEAHRIAIPELPHNLLMYVHEEGDIYISQTIASEGIWERGETRFLLSVLAEGQVFVDVGANIGYFSLLASRLVGGGGAVLAFEPEAENFALLEKNVQLNDCDNVRCFRAALGREDATGNIYLCEENKGDHAICPTEGGRDSQQISILNGTGAIADLYKRVDFVKIDTQGFECEVIEGLLPLLQASLPDLIMLIELSPLHLESAGASGAELLDLLARLDDAHIHVIDSLTNKLVQLSWTEAHWIAKKVNTDAARESFANLIVSGNELPALRDTDYLHDLGMFESPLAYLALAGQLEAWDGRACRADEFSRYFYFASGWGGVEQWGSWCLGGRSRLKVSLAQELQHGTALTLHFSGHYHRKNQSSEVYINGRLIGEFNLVDCRIPLHEVATGSAVVTIELVHPDVVAQPEPTGSEPPVRDVRFGLESIALESD